MEPVNTVRITSRQDIERLEQRPLHEHLPAQNTYTLLKQCAQSYADNIALRFLPAINEDDISYSYGDFSSVLPKRPTPSTLWA